MGEKLNKRLKQVKPLNIEHEAVLNLFLAGNFIRKKIDDVCSKYNITNAQYNVLRILKGNHPDGYPRCEIIPRMIDQAPDVTRIIDNLEKQHLVSRSVSNDDRRLSVTKITSKGLNLIMQMEDEMRSVDKYIIENLTKTEIRQLSEICEKIYGSQL